MINENKPKVRKLIGKVNNLRINPIVPLASAIKMAAIIADPKPSTFIPGTKYAPNKTVTPMSNKSIKSFSIFLNFKVYCLFLIIITILKTSCNNKEFKKDLIKFNSDSTAILIEIADNAVYNSLVQRKNEGETLTSIISVVEIENEIDSLFFEKEILGSVELKNEKLIFTPKSEMRKGSTYNITTMLGSGLGGAKATFNQALNVRGGGIQGTLTR